jgi:hypothetical protein
MTMVEDNFVFFMNCYQNNTVETNPANKPGLKTLTDFNYRDKFVTS